jgi:hypothetical protein
MLYNVLGRLVYSDVFQQNFSINTYKLNRGFYVVTVDDGQFVYFGRLLLCKIISF